MVVEGDGSWLAGWVAEGEVDGWWEGGDLLVVCNLSLLWF